MPLTRQKNLANLSFVFKHIALMPDAYRSDPSTASAPHLELCLILPEFLTGTGPLARVGRSLASDKKKGQPFYWPSLGYPMEATGGFEPPNNGFADHCLTTWLRRR